MATPDPFVVTVSDTPPPEKVPLTPEPGAVKVTETPETGLLPASTTIAVRTEAKAVEIVALCPPPEGEVKAEGGANRTARCRCSRSSIEGELETETTSHAMRTGNCTTTRTIDLQTKSANVNAIHSRSQGGPGLGKHLKASLFAIFRLSPMMMKSSFPDVGLLGIDVVRRQWSSEIFKASSCP
ncbi:hypothetical protein [Pseudophaeobacter sp. TrK17]|uniref:hypothetical protein n=1 Tax=Pseudophaeobacter sp. TrK17 TaxID=2815167 RepID=UPI0035D08757